ncbi:MAG: hypothetical protein ACPF9K_11045 [Neptuniibacter sp.]
MRKKALRVFLFFLIALLSALAAYAIYFISDAHGHGLASNDRLAIYALSFIALLSFIAGLSVIKQKQ